SEENRVLRTLCFVLQAAQNPSHAFPNAACGGYKQLNELSCLNGNSMSIKNSTPLASLKGVLLIPVRKRITPLAAEARGDAERKMNKLFRNKQIFDAAEAEAGKPRLPFCPSHLPCACTRRRAAHPARASNCPQNAPGSAEPASCLSMQPSQDAFHFL
ncbi:MAG: hypothetical protein IJ906_08095, partial [Oscillospiraceae bacterium]|nr:hypothetical protein [Oscillospiraceae bacterium]